MGLIERREKEKQQRRFLIIGAAKKVFKDQGFEKASMQKIADEAELGKGTIYHYFRDKPDLAIAVLEESFEKIQELLVSGKNLQADGVDKIRFIIEGFLRFRKEDSEAFYFTLLLEYFPSLLNYKNSNLILIVHDMTDVIEQILKEGIQDGTIRPNISPRKTAVLLIHLSTSLLQRLSNARGFIEKSTDVDADELLDHLLVFFMNALEIHP